MNGPPSNRRFHFSLRTAFVGLTLAALVPWLAANFLWMHQRSEMAATPLLGLEGDARAPWPLWLLGAKGYARVRNKVPPQNIPALEEAAREKRIHYQRFFPEAEEIIFESNAD